MAEDSFNVLPAINRRYLSLGVIIQPTATIRASFAPSKLQERVTCLESRWVIFVTIAFWEEEVPLKYLLKGVLTATKNGRSMTNQKQGEISALEVKHKVALEVEV